MSEKERTEDNVIDLDDFLRHSLSRRDALKYGLGLGAGVLGADVLAACSSGSTASTTPSATASASAAAGPASPPEHGATIPTPRKQTLIVTAGNPSQGQSPFTAYGSFNTFIPNGNDYHGGFGQVCKEYLWYLNLATGELKPWLATAWKYNSDATQLTISLNPKAHWNDGEPFTSRDVKFTIEFLQNHKELLGSSGESVQQAKSVATPDDHTVVITLTQTNTRYHYAFICGVIGGFLVVPEHIWSKQDPTTFRNNPPVFTGPYKLKESNRALQYYLWEKDPKYWAKDQLNPAPKYVAFRVGPAPDALSQEFKEAKFDQGALYSQTKALIDSGYKNAIITTMIDPCPRAMIFNCDASKGILADPRMRWVVSSLIDRNKVGNGIWPVKAPAAFFPWPGYANLKKWEKADIAGKYPLTYNPAKAAQLLDEMGARKGGDGKRTFNGQPISIEIITPVPPTGPEYQAGQLLADELQKQGIDASIKSLAGPVYSDRTRKGQFDIKSEWGPCSTLDPYQTYQGYQSQYYKPVGETAQSNSNRVKDPALDDLVAQLAKSTADDPAAGPLFDQALEEWYRQMPQVPYLQTMYTHQANTTYWKGWPTDDNLYQVPNSWWGQFMFIVGAVKPTGKS